MVFLRNLHDDDIHRSLPIWLLVGSQQSKRPVRMMAGRRAPRQKGLGRYAGVSRVVVLDDDDDDRQ
jgi:hypothetical protein